MGDASDEKLPARLLEVTIGDWPGLGGDVRLELSGQRTVLVGKNGTGKSLILTGLARAAREAWFPPAARPRGAPQHFQCAIQSENNQTLFFEYRWRPVDDESELEESLSGLEAAGDERPTSGRLLWSERCWRSDETVVWKVEKGVVTIGDSTPVVIGPGVSLLSAFEQPHDTLPERDVLLDVLFGATIVPAGVPRSEEESRGAVLLRGKVSRSGKRSWSSLSPGRVALLARRIATLWEARRSHYDELEALALRLGLVREGFSMKVYEDPQKDLRQSERRDLADLVFDDVNIGLLSDGTLRATEILIDLVQPRGHLLLIEEPETAVHPGLLSKLLAELEAYSLDRQLIVSTHSSRVVDWCERQPGAVRLVEREANRTTIRSLTPEEVGRVARYLDDEGTLSDFVYHQVDP